MLIEYLAQRIIRGAAPRTPIPVVVNGTIVGAGLSGRASVSVDFSWAGDPLDVRHARMAFSAHQFHRLRPDVVGARMAMQVPAAVAVPRGTGGMWGTRAVANGSI